MTTRRQFALATLGLAPLGLQQPGAADPLRDPRIAGRSQRIISPLDNNETVKAIERRLRCTCPCGLDIFTCRTTDFTCTYSPELHQEVLGLFEGGKTADEIVAAFQAKYGDSILLAPPTTGFNLLGYLLPSALVLAVGGALAFVLLRRHRNRLVAARVQRPASPQQAGPSGDDRARLARMLEEMDR